MTVAAYYFFLLLVIYPYALYPILLALAACARSRELPNGSARPSITIIISAYNEERFIAAKLENTLSLEYPAEKREVIVVSDCSSDRTDEIVKGYGEKGISLLTLPVRRGKTAGLNEAVRAARGEIVVFSDADSIYEQDALIKIACTFSGDSRVGLVTGSTRYLSAGDGAMTETGGVYSRLEYFIKRRETLLGSCVGADGAIFAVRKALYLPLRDDDINDLAISLMVVRQGFRSVLRDDLYCREKSSPDALNEFRRQTRITNRTLVALFRNADLMNPLRHPVFGFQLFSHKLMRFLAPWCMIALFACNTLLLREGAFYAAAWTGQALAYLFVLVRYLKERAGGGVDILGLPYHFIMVNISMLAGWIQFLSGRKTITWNPRGR
jgi:cellulose synthase/poly-beta-1,6-N-acetylglucosamine synthase-like glycosyltransferase